MKQKAIAEIYHQETKYYECEMAKHQRPLDWSSQPSPYKSYHTEKKIDLVPYLPLRNNPFTEKPIEPVLEDKGYPFGIGAISRLLYFTNGVTGILQYPNGQSLSLRAAPTAGGLYPTECYIAVRDVSTLDDGVYNFQVKDHSLVPVWEGNFWSEFEKYCLGHEAIGQSQLLVILTAVYRRSAWRYHERAYRRILLDTGHVLGNLFAYAHEESFSPCPIAGFVDKLLNRLLFLEEAEEGVLFVVALPQHQPNNVLRHDALMASSSHPLSDIDWHEDAENPLLLRLHQSSSMLPEEPSAASDEEQLPEPSQAEGPSQAEEKYAIKPKVLLSGAPIDWQNSMGPTILLRRSTRAYLGKSCSKEVLSSILEYAYPSPDVTSLVDASLLETYLVIQRVEGVDAGVYYYAPEQKSLRTIYSGDFKNQTWHFCLGQDLAKDAAALVIHTAFLKDALMRYGNRAYRYLHLDAGYIGQRINLAAIRLGLGVSGIGGFYDDEVNALLGLSLEHIIVYITTLGQPYGQ
ncbi:MAG: SagB/ThcOx family dehydrogenase [Nitrospiria bacterium]